MSFFDIFQLASIAIVLLLFATRACHLFFVRNINPIAIGRGKKGWSLAIELIAFVGLIVWIAEVALRALHSSVHIVPAVLNRTLIDSTIGKSIGVVLVTAALLLFAFAFLSFGNSWRVGLDTRTPGALVTSGTFAFSRNPIFVSLDLWFIGIFLINGTLIFLIFALLAAAVLHWQMIREEKFLTELYGERYREYFARTARYVIW
jgi:protein-S-isoprenylcysteine O-methyltransferase Ste14